MTESLKALPAFMADHGWWNGVTSRPTTHKSLTVIKQIAQLTDGHGDVPFGSVFKKEFA